MSKYEATDQYPDVSQQGGLDKKAYVVHGRELIAITFGDRPGMERVTAELIAGFFNKRADECETAGAKLDQQQRDSALLWMFQGGSPRHYHHQCMRVGGEYSIAMSTLGRMLEEGVIENASHESFRLTTQGFEAARALFKKAEAAKAGTRIEQLEALYRKRKATCDHIHHCELCQGDTECRTGITLMLEEDAILRSLDREG